MHPIKLALFLLVFFVSWINVSQGQSTREQLNQMVQELATMPHGSGREALRERILKLAAGIIPAPAVPPEAERFEARAQYAFKNAKSESELLDAVSEYVKAIRVAPWVAGYYFDVCVILEKANRPAKAIHSCKLYLLGVPDAPDAGEVRKRIAGLEYALERRRESFSRRIPGDGSHSDLYEIGAKVANIGNLKISIKLISSMYSGTFRNQLQICDITNGKSNCWRRNLEILSEALWLDARIWYPLTISYDGRITFGGGAAEIVTSIAELTQLRNDQIDTHTVVTKDGKNFLYLLQGGELQGDDGAFVAGVLFFPSDCSGKLVGVKPGWLPVLFSKYADVNFANGIRSLGFRAADPDACEE